MELVYKQHEIQYTLVIPQSFNKAIICLYSVASLHVN